MCDKVPDLGRLKRKSSTLPSVYSCFIEEKEKVYITINDLYFTKEFILVSSIYTKNTPKTFGLLCPLKMIIRGHLVETSLLQRGRHKRHLCLSQQLKFVLLKLAFSFCSVI